MTQRTNRLRSEYPSPRACFVMLSLLLAATPATAGDTLPPGLQPYRVDLIVSFEDVPALPANFRDRVRQEVRQFVDRTVGERWEFSLAEDQDRGLIALSTLSVAAVPVERRQESDAIPFAFPAESAPDKILFVTVVADGPGFTIQACEWDRLTDTLGPIQSARAVTRDQITHAIVSAAMAAFRPIAQVGESDDSSAQLSFRAAGIPAPDPSAGRIEAGTILRPVLRRFDRDRNLIEVRPVPFTLLTVSEAAEVGTATAEVHSALRSALGGRRSSVEAWAIVARSAAGATRLTLVRREDEVPLAGRIVEIRPRPATRGEEEPPAEATLVTDRSGSVLLPSDADRPIVFLTIKSGDAVLLRLPVAPGVERQLTLPLGDDQLRIEAEGRLAVLSGELIEAVAKRATLLAKARSAARSGRYAEADAALAEAEKLPDAAAFRRRFAAIEAPAAKAADEAGDRVAAARLRSLGRKATGLVDRYLNADPLRATREEVEELKRTDPDHDAKTP